MDTNQQKDDRFVTTPIKRLQNEVLAPERHDLFLSALTVVHKDKRLTKEVAAAAYLDDADGRSDGSWQYREYSA
jgi:hypothetical protein